MLLSKAVKSTISSILPYLYLEGGGTETLSFIASMLISVELYSLIKKRKQQFSLSDKAKFKKRIIKLILIVLFGMFD